MDTSTRMVIGLGIGLIFIILIRYAMQKATTD